MPAPGAVDLDRASIPAIITPVNFQVAARQSEGYQIATEVFEGPLDLLLELIERAELDITRLALAQVTDQYLEYLKHLEDRNAGEVSAFLVIAARLLQIKSAALLPRPELPAAPGQEEDPAEALARQLIIYKRFKELAGELEARQNAGWHTYLRVAPPPMNLPAGKVDLSGITVDDLVEAARQVFAAQIQLPALSEVVNMPRVTIREKIHHILDGLRQKGFATFRGLISPGASRSEIVISFLAMLELVKRHIVEARQVILFGEIELHSQETNFDEQNDDLEIEFEDA